MPKCFYFFLLWTLPLTVNASIFGEENLALAKLVTGQILELERLAQIVGVTSDSQAVLQAVNRGIDSTVAQLESIEEISRRSQGLDPGSVRTLSELNRQLTEARGLAEETSSLVRQKLALIEVSVSQAALQSETSYLMGQEMVSVGRSLSAESRSASPGRAAQITAAAQSSQMLAQGVQLQTLSHLVQLQAESLDLQKAALARQQAVAQAQEEYFRDGLKAPLRKKRARP